MDFWKTSQIKAMFLFIYLIIPIIKCHRYLIKTEKGHKHVVSDKRHNALHEHGTDYLDSVDRRKKMKSDISKLKEDLNKTNKT